MRRLRNTQQLVRVRDVFDAWAESGRAENLEAAHEPVARQAFTALELKPNQRYLDIGCGNGYTVRWAAQVATSVDALGIDVSSHMVTLARQMTSRLPNARFRRGSFPVGDLKPHSFHAIFSMEAFYYLPDVMAGLRAVRELLVTGGKFACVVNFYLENPASHHWPEAMGVDMQLLSAQGWYQAFVDAGLTVERQERLSPHLAPNQTPTWQHTEGSLFTLGKVLD